MGEKLNPDNVWVCGSGPRSVQAFAREADCPGPGYVAIPVHGAHEAENKRLEAALAETERLRNKVKYLESYCQGCGTLDEHHSQHCPLQGEEKRDESEVRECQQQDSSCCSRDASMGERRGKVRNVDEGGGEQEPKRPPLQAVPGGVGQDPVRKALGNVRRGLRAMAIGATQ